MKFFKKNAYVLLAMILLAASIGFAYGIYYFLGNDGTVSTTSVGHFAVVDSNTKEEIITDLSSKIEGTTGWKSQAKYLLTYQNIEFEVNMNLLTFDAETTYKNLRSNTVNKAYFTVSDEQRNAFIEDLSNKYGVDTIEKADITGLVNEIKSHAQTLTTVTGIDMYEFAHNNHENDQATISRYELQGVSAVNSNKIVQEISGDEAGLSAKFVIEPGRFSVIKAFSDYDLNDNQLSIIATGLSKIILQTSFTSFDVSQSKLDPLSEEEFEFMVVKPKVSGDPTRYDFAFYNPESYPYTVEISHSAISSGTGGLTFSLTGLPFIYHYSAADVSTNTIVTKTVAKTETKEYNAEFFGSPECIPSRVIDVGVVAGNSLGYHEYNYVVIEGSDGKMVSYYRETKDLEGKLLSRVLLFDVRIDCVNRLVYYFIGETIYD